MLLTFIFKVNPNTAMYSILHLSPLYLPGDTSKYTEKRSGKHKTKANECLEIGKHIHKSKKSEYNSSEKPAILTTATAVERKQSK